MPAKTTFLVFLAIAGCNTAPPQIPVDTNVTSVDVEPAVSHRTEVQIPENLGRSVVLRPVTRFRLPVSSACSSPREVLRQSIHAAGFAAHDDPDSGDALRLTARTDQGDLAVAVRWITCGREWIVSVDGGADREILSAAVMGRLREALRQGGTASADGGVDGVWAAGNKNSVLTFNYLWPDVSWKVAIDAACAEKGWEVEQRDVLMEAYELFVVDRDQGDIGLIVVELEGELQFSFAGNLCGTEQGFIERFLHHWSLVPETQPSCQTMTRGEPPSLRD